MNNYLVYLLYKVLKVFFILCPKIIIKPILNLLASVIYVINKEHKNIAYINVKLAFNDSKTEEQRMEIIKESYKSLLYNMYEFILNQSSTSKQIFKKVNLLGEEYLLEAIKEKRKIIFVASHYGAWEVAVPYIALKFGPVSIVNRRMDNNYINDEYIKARNRNNVQMIDKREAAKGMLRALKDGKFLAVAVDQNTKYGIDIDFFGKKVKSTDSTARLSTKFDALLIPIFCTIEDLGKYTIEFKKPIDPRNFTNENKISELTQAQANVIEEQVRKVPTQWFWQHKRWKAYHKDLYKRK